MQFKGQRRWIIIWIAYPEDYPQGARRAPSEEGVLSWQLTLDTFSVLGHLLQIILYAQIHSDLDFLGSMQATRIL